MRFAFMICGFLALSAAFGVGCGSTTNGTKPSTSVDAGSDGTTVVVEAGGGDADPGGGGPYPIKPPTGQSPQVVTAGGPVMKTPKIVPVFFGGDDSTTTAALADLVKKIGQTQYWKANTTEYGVGAATGGDPIQLAEIPAATTDDSVIQTWLANKLNTNDPAWGTPDENTIYALYYPMGVSITIDGSTAPGTDAGIPVTDGGEAGVTAEDGGDAGVAPSDGGTMPPPGGRVQASCTDFGGYHQSIQLDQAHGFLNVAYAVLPRCPAFDGFTAMDGLTGASSHEFIEAATDPFPYFDPAYVQVDDAHIYWSSILGGSETCDMCAQFVPSSFTKFAELPEYQVQRCWSNKAELAGQDPCVPALPNEVYFNAVPVLDTVPLSFAGQTINAKGVQIPVGQSKTIEVDLFSTAPTAPWSVSAQVLGPMGSTAPVTITFDKDSGVNGDKLQMTINVLTATKRNRETFILYSQLGTQMNIWVGAVVQ